jgi:hypothetical protein
MVALWHAGVVQGAAAHRQRSALTGANEPLEVPAKHHSSGLLASLMVTLVTVGVQIIVVRTSLCPSHCCIVRISSLAWGKWLATLWRNAWADAR